MTHCLHSTTHNKDYLFLPNGKFHDSQDVVNQWTYNSWGLVGRQLQEPCRCFTFRGRYCDNAGVMTVLETCDISTAFGCSGCLRPAYLVKESLLGSILWVDMSVLLQRESLEITEKQQVVVFRQLNPRGIQRYFTRPRAGSLKRLIVGASLFLEPVFLHSWLINLNNIIFTKLN
jgi:hypothetical protein